RAPRLQVVLVVGLGGPELGRGRDLGDDRAREPRLGRLLRCLRLGLLLGRVEEDRRAVLIADVRALPVELRRVVQLPERVQQLVVGHLLGVELDEHGLGVAGRVAADLLIRRWVRAPARVPDGRLDRAGNLPEAPLAAPEAPRRERRLLGPRVRHRITLPGRSPRTTPAYSSPPAVDPLLEMRALGVEGGV